MANVFRLNVEVRSWIDGKCLPFPVCDEVG